MGLQLTVAYNSRTSEVLAWGNMQFVEDSLKNRPAGIGYYVEDLVFDSVADAQENLPADKLIFEPFQKAVCNQ